MNVRYQPPAFRFPVADRPRMASLAVVLAWCLPAPLVLLAVQAWWHGHGGWLWWALVGAGAACSWGLCRYGHARASGWLAWDGLAWAWQDAQGHAWAISLEKVWDGQNCLWLRCRPLRASPPAPPGVVPGWLWLEREAAVPFWGELRRALHFSRVL